MTRTAIVLITLSIAFIGVACGGSTDVDTSTSAQASPEGQQQQPSAPACLSAWNGSENARWQEYLVNSGYPDVGYGETGDGMCVIVARNEELGYIGFEDEENCPTWHQATFCLTDVSDNFPDSGIGYPDFSGLSPATMASDGKLS